MAIVGGTDLWADFFPDDLIPDILDMVIEVWSSFVKPSSHEHEVPITKRFRSSLEDYKDLKRLPVRIDRETPVDNLNTAEELGRIDLRLTHGYRSNVYFAFECKRLNVISKSGRIRSLASEYVGQGMARFLGSSPQYSRNLTQGGMIAYVMNGKTKNAIKSIDRKMRDHYADLYMQSQAGLTPSSHVSKSIVKESLHHLPDRQFTLHHVFLCV
jgi:hypothetical protein